MTINMAEYMAARREKRRNDLITLAGGKCEKCGSLDNLEFNHKDRATKVFSLSGYNLDTSWSKILAEFDKCELLCKECHLEYTRGQHARGEIRPWNDKKQEPYVHGTMRMYHETKCKCELCRKAKKLYRNKKVKYSDVIE